MLHVPFPEEGEYDTIAGFIVDQLGRIPTEDEHPSVEYGSLILTVEETEDRRISRVRIERKEMPEEENEDDE
jgi:putative hemolysin